MRSPSLQYLYLQKPLTLLLLIAAISVLCWIGMGEFYTKGEPREASVAVSMIKDNNWILPQVYADETAYKPPLTHWLIAVFSLPQETVSPFTSRLPSALAFILMVGVCFVFFGKRVKFQEAFLACLILITSFELHRAAMTARVDMVLTALIVCGLINLFRWEERKQLKGYFISIPLLLGCAALVKGPIGIILPLLVFGVYLLLLKYNFWKIIYKLTIIALPAMILPAIWYYFAYKEGGQAFLDLVWAENFGRFLGTDNLNIQYNLGHEEPIWHYPVTLFAGFIPWALLVFFSLFGLNYTFKIPKIKQLWNNILTMPRTKLFSLVSITVILIFYSIPISKRSVYLMPAYPFIAIFLSQYILYITEYKAKVTKAFSIAINLIGLIIATICLLTVVTNVVEPTQLIKLFTTKEKILTDITLTWATFATPRALDIFLLLVLVFALSVSFYQIRRKNNLKILYATIGTYLAIFIMLDGTFFPVYKDNRSVKPFANEIKEIFQEKDQKIYVLNNLLKYSNMYGLNFYLDNKFINFENEKPDEGLLLIGKNDFNRIYPNYNSIYEFKLLKQADNRCKDGEKVVHLYSFKKGASTPPQ